MNDFENKTLEQQEKRCCENCGNEFCASSIIAVWWDTCVDDNFTTHWKPREYKTMNKYYRVEIVYTGILDMISSNTFTDYQTEKPEATTEHFPMKDIHKAWFENPVEAEKYRQQTVSIMTRR